MATDTLIGIDIGTTAVKAVLTDLDGSALQTFAQPFPTHRPKPGHVEQEPDAWMEAVTTALDALAAHTNSDAVRGIGLCSQVNTHVFVDGDGRPLMPAIVWQDGRSADDAARLDAAITPEQKILWFGGPMPIDASHALSRMAYVARLHPDIYARTRYVLLPKDYCGLQLTGEIATDPISSVGLVDRGLGYIDDLIALVPKARSKLAPLMEFTDCVGRLKPGLPFAGAPLFVGAMDAWAGMFGVGVIDEGDGMYLSGTSEVLGIISERMIATPGVVVFPSYRGITLHAGPTQSGGASLAWISRLLGTSPDDALRLAESTAPSASTPLFLPHLQGERAPLWDIKTRGVFARLDATTGPGDLARSVLEGVALSARLVVEALEASADRVVGELQIGGGGARSDLWCQIRADVLDKVLRRVAVPDAGSIGAAVLAGLGCGVFASLEEATQHLVRLDRTFEPQPFTRGRYDLLFAKYQVLYADLRDFNQSYSAAPAEA